MRGLHETAEPLAVILPAATLATVTSVSPPGSGLFSRLYEAATMALNERAANAVLRAQAVVDTVAAGKMAAAAASVAAVAGGGVAVQGAIRADERPAAIIHRAQAAELAAAPVAATRQRAVRRKARVVRARRAPARTATHRTRRASVPQRQPRQPAQPRPAAAPPPPATTSAPAPRPAARTASTSAAGEFGFEGP